jgi:hypothetical protein
VCYSRKFTFYHNILFSCNVLSVSILFNALGSAKSVAQPHATWQVLVMRTSWTSGMNQATSELVRQQSTSLGGFGKGTDFSTFFLRVWCLPLLHLGFSTSTFLDEFWFSTKFPKTVVVVKSGTMSELRKKSV